MPGAQDKGTKGWGGWWGGCREGSKEEVKEVAGVAKRKGRGVLKKLALPHCQERLLCSQGFAAPVPHYNCPLCLYMDVQVCRACLRHFCVVLQYMPSYICTHSICM